VLGTALDWAGRLTHELRESCNDDFGIHPVVREWYGALIAMVQHQPAAERWLEGAGRFGTPAEPMALPWFTACRLTGWASGWPMTCSPSTRSLASRLNRTLKRTAKTCRLFGECIGSAGRGAGATRWRLLMVQASPHVPSVVWNAEPTGRHPGPIGVTPRAAGPRHHPMFGGADPGSPALLRLIDRAELKEYS
jgi:hypothetical protein